MKDPQPHLLPECFGDTMLVNTLIDGDSNHKRSISEVFVALKKSFKHRKAVGIIDDDRKKDAYYKEFVVSVETDHYRYMAHPNKLHYLIVIKKDLEDFLIKCGELSGANHPLLQKRGELKRTMKTSQVDKSSEIKGLLNTLIQKKAKPLMEIKQILEKHKL